MSPDPAQQQARGGPLSVPCPACGTVNELAAAAPAVGHRLVCSACGAALVETRPDANGADPVVLWRLFRFYDRAAINPTCPHCNGRNVAVCVPANDRWGWHVHSDRAAAADDGHHLPLPCVHCGEEFCVGWD